MRITKATNITASTTDVLEPTVDNVLNLIENKKIIFKNDVAYWSKGKRVLPKEYRDCIEQTQYAHWINEWSCEQAEKFGDRAYYDYDGDTEVKATDMRITKAIKTDVNASIDTEFSSRLGDALRNALIDAGFSKRKVENMGITELMNACHEVGINCDPYIINAREASSLSAKTDVKASSNYNLWSEGQLRSKMFEIGFNPNGLSKAEMIADLEQYDADISKENTDVSSCKASTSTDVKASKKPEDKFLGTVLIEKRDDGRYYLENFPVAPNDRCRYMWKNSVFHHIWDSLDAAISEIESTLNVKVNPEQTCQGSHLTTFYLYGPKTSIMSDTSTDKALQHIKAAIDILGTSGDKSDLTRDSIANLGVVMFDLKSKQ